MAILQSCCFWKSVRTGSYASAWYTLIYFGFSSTILLFYVREEQEYLSGRRENPTGESILEHGDITPITVIFNISFLTCSLILVISSVLVIVALRYNKRELMLPWIIFMMGDLLIELSHLIYLGLTESVIFEPVVGFLFTIDFFIMFLNCYCLLCVVSQYQEYRQGRGCERTPLTTPQIVLHVSQTDVNGTARSPKLYRQKLFQTTAYISSHHMNISTIPEENEQKCKSPEDQNSRSWQDTSSRRPTISSTGADAGNRLNIPSI